jgi:hypothetical protein
MSLNLAPGESRPSCGGAVYRKINDFVRSALKIENIIVIFKLKQALETEIDVMVKGLILGSKGPTLNPGMETRRN